MLQPFPIQLCSGHTGHLHLAAAAAPCLSHCSQPKAAQEWFSTGAFQLKKKKVMEECLKAKKVEN